MNIKAKVLLTALVLSVASGGCASSSDAAGLSSGASASAEVTDVSVVSGGEVGGAEIATQTSATQVSWEGASATAIAFNGESATVTGEGAVASGGTVTITQGGVYVLSGSLRGSVVVTAPATDAVGLVLNGVEITADKNAAIYCTQADQLTITLAEGTTNSVADAENFTYSDTAKEEPDAAVFSKVDLVVNGGGSLVVTAGYNNGIGTKDDLVIEGGVLNITAANHGMRGRDSVTVTGGDLTIAAGADGIQSNNDEDVSKGWISLSGGTYNIAAGNDAIQAETSLAVSAGSYNLTAGGGHSATPADTTGSYKGLKAGGGIDIQGGEFAIDSADDAVHANGGIAVSGGSFTLATGDDGIHADGDLTISGSATRIEITACYEGLEGKTMTIADGVVTINSTDDGINIAGGNDSGNGQFGADRFSGVSGDQWLLISGGTITVKAGSDAIDINGNGEMTGGTVDLTAAMLGEGQTLDVDGTWTRTGGELTETGGSGFGGGFGGGGRGGSRGQPPV